MKGVLTEKWTDGGVLKEGQREIARVNGEVKLGGKPEKQGDAGGG